MKVWKKPQLVVLTRTKPEEAVLVWCKMMFAYGSGPETGYPSVGCFMVFGSDCGECTAYNPS